MANHLTNSQISTILAKTVGNCKPGELDDIQDALSRMQVTRGPDFNRSMESTMTTIFTAEEPNWP
jgi:hypothetical protein